MATTIRVFRSTDTNGTNRTQVGGDFPDAVANGQFSVGVPTTGWPAGTYYIQSNAEDVTDGKSVSVFSTPAQQIIVNAAAANAFSDDFNRADGVLGSPWADAYNRLGNQIVSNRMVRNAAAGSKSELPTYAFTGDHFVQARCSYADTLVIISSTAPGTSGDSQGVRVTNDGFNDMVTLYRMVGGTYTSLQTAGMTLAAGDPWVRLEVRGADNFRVLTSTDGTTWTTRINYTDATPLSNRGVPGFEIGGVDGWIDDVSVGAI